MLYSLFRKLPFKEAAVPIKMLRGRIRNRNYKLPTFEDQCLEGGELEHLRGVPLVRLAGSPTEIGRQHGALVGEQAAALYDRYLTIFGGRFDYDLKLAERMLPFVPERYVEEMQGFAETSGMGWDKTLLTNCFLDIHKVALCSTFVVRDQSSRNGQLIFGRNLDFPSLSIAHQASMVFVVYPDQSKPFVSVGWPGFLGVLSGMNEAGMTLAMMLIYGHTRSDHLEGTPFPLHYRSVLENSSSVRQATEILKRREFAVCNNMMLADADRDAAVLELHTKELGEIRDDSDFPVLRCTNHFRTGFRKWAMALSAPSSFARIRKLNKAARAGKPFSSTMVKSLLGDVAIPGINIQRMLFHPEQREIEVGFQGLGRGERPYVSFTKEELWRRPKRETTASTS